MMHDDPPMDDTFEEGVSLPERVGVEFGDPVDFLNKQADMMVEQSIIDSFADKVKELRERFAERNIGKHVSIQLSATGYPTQGSFDVIARVCIDYESTLQVEGIDLDRIVDEVLRRYDFKMGNRPLCLPRS